MKLIAMALGFALLPYCECFVRGGHIIGEDRRFEMPTIAGVEIDWLLPISRYYPVAQVCCTDHVEGDECTDL